MYISIFESVSRSMYILKSIYILLDLMQKVKGKNTGYIWDVNF